MKLLVRQVLAVARVEWCVAWRGLGLRLVIVLVALPFVALNFMPGHHITPWADDGGVGDLTFTAAFAALVAAFVVVPSYRRDLTLPIVDIVWVRPLSGAAYVAGKVIGAALVMGVILIEITALVVLYQLTGGGTVGIPLLVGVALGVAPALLLTAVLCVACSLLLPHPLLGYLAVLVYCSLFGFFLTQSMVLVWNPWAQSLTYSRFLGFGGDLPLLLANRFFYTGVLLSVAGGALLLVAWRERRALAPAVQGWAALAVLVVGACMAGTALPLFHSAAAAVTLSGPVVAPRPVPVAIRDYRLDLRLDPTTGIVQGIARFTVANNGPASLATLPLYLNDGLRVRSATLDSHAVAVRNTALFSTLTVVPALVPSRQATVQIVYAGRYKLVRPQYAPDRPGFLGRPTMMLPPLHPSLIGAGQAFLFRDGDWYPRPWTQAVTTWSPPPLGWRSLRIVLPARVPVLVSTDRLRHDGAAQVATWSLAGRLPTAILAAIPPGYTRLVVPGGTVYVPIWDAYDIPARYGSYVTALRDLTAFFGRPVRPIAVVAVPPSRGGTVSVGVALGDGLALVPIGSLEQPLGGPAAISRLTPAARYRAALSDLAVAWWADHLRTRTYPTFFDSSVDLPSGYVSVADMAMTMGVDQSQMLAGYTGAAVAAQRLGPAFYEREMDLRRTVTALVAHDPGQQSRIMQRLDQGRLGATLRALGLTGRLDVFDATPVLDDVRRMIGPARLQHLLGTLAMTGQTPSDLTSVACALSHASGQPVAALTLHYLGRMGVEQGACR